MGFDNAISPLVAVSSGVSRGSILGPLLFCLAVDPLPGCQYQIHESSGCLLMKSVINIRTRPHLCTIRCDAHFKLGSTQTFKTEHTQKRQSSWSSQGIEILPPLKCVSRNLPWSRYPPSNILVSPSLGT